MSEELSSRAAAWGMSAKALAYLLECGRGAKGCTDDPDNHHLRFEGKKIFLRVRIKKKHIEEKLPSDLAKAREARDNRLIQLGFNHQLFNRNREAYNARKNK
jgi:hypothetical protein